MTDTSKGNEERIRRKEGLGACGREATPVMSRTRDRVARGTVPACRFQRREREFWNTGPPFPARPCAAFTAIDAVGSHSCTRAPVKHRRKAFPDLIKSSLFFLHSAVTPTAPSATACPCPCHRSGSQRGRARRGTSSTFTLFRFQ